MTPLPLFTGDCAEMQAETRQRIVLRDYQTEAVNAGIRYFCDTKQKKGALMVLPTGSGKSLVIAGIAAAMNEPTLVFQPTKEILEQNYGKLRAFGQRAAVYSASMNSKQVDKLTFATIGSVRNHPELFQHFRNIIIDECHYVNAKKGMYKEFLKNLGTEKVLGLTATPYRLVSDGFGGSILKFLTRTRPRVFANMIYYVQNRRLFDDGYLSPLEYKCIEGFDTGQLRLNTTGADYTDRSVRNYYKRSNFSGRLAETVSYCLDNDRRNVLVFTRFIDESKSLVDAIGHDKAAIVTGDTPKRERERILSDFRGGRIPVVANVGVLTVGFDFPELETIVMARPTMSLALYYQMIGRGIRPHPDKGRTWVVDLCANFDKFGRVEDLKLTAYKPKLWIIESQGEQLTNKYYGERRI